MYPSEIDISDGKLINEIEGFTSANFNHVCEKADNDAKSKSEWHSLLVWIISQVLHENARDSFIKSLFVINSYVDKKRFRKFLIHNLKQKDYEDMNQEFLDYERQHGVIA